MTMAPDAPKDTPPAPAATDANADAVRGKARNPPPPQDAKAATTETTADKSHHQPPQRHQVLDPLILSYLPISTVGSVLPQVSRTLAADSSSNAYWRPIFEQHFRGSAAHRCLLQLEQERQDAEMKAKNGGGISDDRASKRQKLEDEDENINGVDEKEEIDNKGPAIEDSKMGFDMNGNQWKTAFRIVRSAVHKVKTGGNHNEGNLPPAMLRTGNLTKAELDKLQVDLISDLKGEQIHRAEEIMENDDGFGEDRWRDFDVAELGVETQRMLQDFVARSNAPLPPCSELPVDLCTKEHPNLFLDETLFKVIGSELIAIAKTKQVNYDEQFIPYRELVALDLETGSVTRRVSLEDTGVSCYQSPSSFAVDSEWIVMAGRAPDGKSQLVILDAKTFDIVHRLSPPLGLVVNEGSSFLDIILTDEAIIASYRSWKKNDNHGEIYAIFWDRKETREAKSHFYICNTNDIDHHEIAIIGGKLGILLNVSENASIVLAKGHYLQLLDLPSMNQVTTRELASEDNCVSSFVGSGGSMTLTVHDENGITALHSVNSDGMPLHFSVDIFGYQNRSGTITRATGGHNFLLINISDEGNEDLRFGSNELDLYTIHPNAGCCISCTRLFSSYSETPLGITASQWSVVAGCGGKQKTLGELLDEAGGGIRIEELYEERDFGTWKDVRKLRVWDFTKGAVPLLHDTFAGNLDSASTAVSDDY